MQIATVSRSDGECIDRNDTRGRPNSRRTRNRGAIHIISDEIKVEKEERESDEVKCGLFDGASGTVAGIGKRKGKLQKEKNKKKIKKRQPKEPANSK